MSAMKHHCAYEPQPNLRDSVNLDGEFGWGGTAVRTQRSRPKFRTQQDGNSVCGAQVAAYRACLKRCESMA